MKDKTLIVVAHRLNTIVGADQDVYKRQTYLKFFQLTEEFLPAKIRNRGIHYHITSASGNPITNTKDRLQIIINICPVEKCFHKAPSFN